MRILDISVEITPELPIWPGDPRVQIERYMAISDGDAANVSRLACSVHVGTHVDAPVHFVDDGATVENLLLDVLIGPAVLVELLNVDAITAECLKSLSLPPETTRVLFKTRNADLWADPQHDFYPDYVALTPDAADWVVRRGIRLVGVDYLSVSRFHDLEPLTHRTLLEAGVVVAEGLDLREVPPGQYQLICLPIKLAGSDGAPARAVLISEE